jgi:hypothetical protein
MIPSATITAEQLKALQKANFVGTEQVAAVPGTQGYVGFKVFGEPLTISVPVTFIIRGEA